VAKSILIVEDNQTNAQLLKDVLVIKGYDVNIVTNGDDALTSMEASKPDLVLMDVQLPGMDGYEVTRKMRDNPQTKELPVIAVTAYALKGDREKAMEAGCDGYMSKPINTRELPKMVENLIGKSD
jgi:CheY-like chemotaxis protein